MKSTFKKILVLIIGGFIAVSIQSCDKSVPDLSENGSNFVSIKGQHFIDPQGRNLILHGISFSNKEQKTKYLGHVGPEDFEKIIYIVEVEI